MAGLNREKSSHLTFLLLSCTGMQEAACSTGLLACMYTTDDLPWV